MQMKCGWCEHIQDVRTWQDECRKCGESEFVELETDYSGNLAESKNKMNIINLTPHEINIHVTSDVSASGAEYPEIISVPPSGEVARVAQSREALPDLAFEHNLIPVSRSAFGAIEDLPEPKENTIYIVSGLVLSRTTRQDVFAPGEAIRNDKGQIIGCNGLSAASERAKAMAQKA